MKLTRRQLKNIILKEMKILSEESDKYTVNVIPDFVRHISSAITGRTLYVPDNVEKIINAKLQSKEYGGINSAIQIGESFAEKVFGNPKVAIPANSNSSGKILANRLNKDEDVNGIFDFEYVEGALLGKTAGDWVPDMLKDVMPHGRSSGLVFVKPAKGKI